MAWKRIHVKCEPAQPGHEIAVAWLSDAGCSMFEASEDGLEAYAKGEELDAEIVLASRADLAALGLVEWLESEVEEENWNARWEADYPEVRVGNVVRVRAPFHPDRVEEAFAHTITVQPRMAFGTGHHGTTHGLLAEMAEMTWDGLSVLDMGCGSGVLGIYAALRGTAHTVAIDIDPWSVRNTAENLLLNGREEGRAFNLREGGADQLTAGDHNSFDVVIANINRNILLEDMAAYCRVLKPSGTLMLSGFMEPDVEILRTEAAQFGLHQTGLRAEQEWRVLTLQR